MTPLARAFWLQGKTWYNPGGALSLSTPEEKWGTDADPA
jgi:hypothetical protein